MKRVRITFRSEVVIEGNTLVEINEKWQNMPLFSNDAEKCGAEFIEVVSTEDADTYEEVNLDECDDVVTDRNGVEIGIGDSVRWFDPARDNYSTNEEYEQQCSRVWEVTAIHEDTICISDDYGDAEVFGDELELFCEPEP